MCCRGQHLKLRWRLTTSVNPWGRWQKWKVIVFFTWRIMYQTIACRISVSFMANVCMRCPAARHLRHNSCSKVTYLLFFFKVTISEVLDATDDLHTELYLICINLISHKFYNGTIRATLHLSIFWTAANTKNTKKSSDCIIIFDNIKAIKINLTFAISWSSYRPKMVFGIVISQNRIRVMVWPVLGLT